MLGKAPLLAVLADLVENLAMLATLYCIAHALTPAALVRGGAMLLAKLVKWGALSASALLMGAGIFALTATPVAPSARP